MKKKHTIITDKLNSNEPGIVNVVMIPTARIVGTEQLTYAPFVKPIKLNK